MAVPSILSRFRPPVPESELEQVRSDPGKILLVKQNERLGNIVLLNSAISALNCRFPSSEIDLLLPANFSSIMENDKRINRVIPVYKKDYIRMPWELAGLIRKLHKRRYDIAIDCSDVDSNSSTGAAYTLLSGARVTAGWNTGGFHNLDAPVYEQTIHASEMYLELLSGIFGVQMTGTPFFEEESGPTRGSNPIIGVNCGGRDNKKWPIDNFIKLGEILSNKGYSVEYILGPDEERERELLSRNLPAGAVVLPLIPVSNLKNVFKKYTVFVSSDTGPMHVAWCLRIPVVAVFLSSAIEKFKPLSERSIAVDGTKAVSPESVGVAVTKIVEETRISV